jgi:3-dehydroquinate dehydratase-1
MKLDDFILAGTTNDLSQKSQAQDIADVIEFQMASADDPITQLSNYEGTLPLIVSNREVFDVDEAGDSDRLDKLLAAARSEDVEIVDLELGIVQRNEWVIEELRENEVLIIVSYCNFEETPSKNRLTDIIEKCAQYGDIAKISVYAEEKIDSLTLLDVVDTATKMGIAVAGSSMGKIGQHTRVIAPFYGSEISYAPINAESSDYVPGQIELQELASVTKMIVEGGDHVELTDSLKGKFS